MAVANLRITVKNLKKKGDDGMTGFQRQMKVMQHCVHIQLEILAVVLGSNLWKLKFCSLLDLLVHRACLEVIGRLDFMVIKSQFSIV